MADEEKFFNEVLVKLHRKYGKDELVSALNKTLSDKEVGQLKSYIDELEDTLKKIENRHKMEVGNLLANPQNLIDTHGFTYVKLSKYQQMQKQLKDQNRKISELRKTNSDLISKIPR